MVIVNDKQIIDEIHLFYDMKCVDDDEVDEHINERLDEVDEVDEVDELDELEQLDSDVMVEGLLIMLLDEVDEQEKREHILVHHGIEVNDEMVY